MKLSPLFIRRIVQIIFSGILVFLGIRFYLFVSCIESGRMPAFERPAGVEAFLPISALMSLKDWVYSGTMTLVHPASLVLFLIICLTAGVVKRGFCSWVCPIGFLSEGAARLNRKLFKTPMRLPSGIDLCLRSLKYLGAGFFLYQILYKMPAPAIEQFLNSPYNQFADIKMLKFFTEMSGTAFIVFLVLVGLTLVIQNFWCRYLCPYGALLGILGFLSLGKIHRHPSHCTECGKCERVCPGHISIRQKTGVNSPECSSCLACVDVCPETEALAFRVTTLGSRALKARKLSPMAMAVFFVLIFTCGIAAAKLTGHWQSNIPMTAYVRYAAPAASPSIPFDQISPEKRRKMILMMQQMKTQ